jgi:multiple sugar transport system substrate-binding protein
MKKQLSVLVALLVAATMILTACGAQPTAAPATAAPATEAPSGLADGKVVIRWSVGLGTGDNPAQLPTENAVVDDFNKAQDKIKLILEVIPNASSQDTIATEIAAGAGPDIVGPVGWSGANSFPGQWLDIAPYLAASKYDSSKFEAALSKMYVTEQGTNGLPFAVYPSAVFYNTGLFTEAGLEPLPAKYGDQYKMPDGTMVDWNWDALTKVAKLLTIDSNGKHSGEAGFDATKIVQYGFTWGWENKATYWGNFMSVGGQLLVPGGSKGSYAAKIPEAWKTAWQWYYDGQWGAEPYVPIAAVEASADFDSGNSFASGKIGMAELPSWYLCCVGDLTKAGGKFEFGAMPIALNDSKPAGRVDADTFRIWKGTKHPAEAFTVLAYLVDTGIQKLVVGSAELPAAYGAIPSQPALRGPWITEKKAAFPFVKNWDILIEGLNYADVPSGEAFMPNFNEAWARTVTFASLLMTTKDVDLAAEEATLESDLTTIFNK